MKIETSFPLTLTPEQAEAVGLVAGAASMQGPQGTTAYIISAVTMKIFQQVAIQLPSPVEIGRSLEKQQDISAADRARSAARGGKAGTPPPLRPAACPPEQRI